MSNVKALNHRETIFKWWTTNIGNRESNSAARALAARLRRATSIEVLAEPAVHALAHRLGLGSSERDVYRLTRLARVLAEVRSNDNLSLAAKLGSSESLSNPRFERLIRSSQDEVVVAIRRALPFIQNQCNVGTLGVDLLFWNERTRAKWCFDFFGARKPRALIHEEIVE